MNVTEISDVADRMSALILDESIPTDKLKELLQAFSKVETDSDDAALAKKRSLTSVMHTMQWRSKENDSGARPARSQSQKTVKSIGDLLDLIKHETPAGLTPEQKTVTRNGSTFQETYYVGAGDQPSANTSSAEKPSSTEKPAKQKKPALSFPPGTQLDNNMLYNALLQQGFVDKVEGLPTDTKTAYQDQSGQYTPERQQLHTEIANHFLDRAKPVPMDKKPVAVITMGGPGSGKSSVTSGMDLEDFVLVDPDAIKAQLPEYQQALGGKALNAARMVHEESSDVAKGIRETAITQRKNLMLDGVGADYDKMASRIESLKASGYHVSLVSVHIPTETAKQRVANRALSSGRWVPLDFVEDAYSKIPGNFDKLSQLTHDAVAYDNSGSGVKMMFSKQHGSEPVTHDPEAYSGYLSGAFHAPKSV
jgi:predicted ABC-type ATPase